MAKLSRRKKRKLRKSKQKNAQIAAEKQRTQKCREEECVFDRLSSNMIEFNEEALSLKFYARSGGGEPLFLQPWTKELVSLTLTAAKSKEIFLCLLWPAPVSSLPQIHALSSLQINYQKNLLGLRTVLFQGNYATRADLDAILIERSSLVNLWKSFWKFDNSSPRLDVDVPSVCYRAILRTFNDIELNHPEIENPSLGEIMPVFVFNDESEKWETRETNPLERSLKKVSRRARKKLLREEVNSEWGFPDKAPGALMVVHNKTDESAWKTALSKKFFEKYNNPNLILFDATSSAQFKGYQPIKRIPQVLRHLSKDGTSATGSVIVTDDPATFFILKGRFHSEKIHYKQMIWPAECESIFLSENPSRSGFIPEERRDIPFKVSIVDRDASEIALKFLKVFRELTRDDGVDGQPLLDATKYILRISNLPCGYKDLTDHAAESEDELFQNQRFAWSPVKEGLRSLISSGAVNHKISDVRDAVSKAERLIDSWTDGTPMALRLRREVATITEVKGGSACIVLPSKRYISLAIRFLGRHLESGWEEIKNRIKWATLASFEQVLSETNHEQNYIFVGVNRNVLKVLLTETNLKQATIVFIAYKEANSIIQTLDGMQQINAFSPYLKRIITLRNSLHEKLLEIPKQLVASSLNDFSVFFKFEGQNGGGSTSTPGYHTFILEDGNRAYSSGWIYKFDSDEDPFFKRVSAKTIQDGDLLFNMSANMRRKLEVALHLQSDFENSEDYPERALLRLYHQDIMSRCEALLKSKTPAARAREIYRKMLEIDPSASSLRRANVYYWLIIGKEDDSRPHAPREKKHFKLFCNALQIKEEQMLQYWGFIRSARQLNQNLGRELSARYAEILFQPESALAYRNVPKKVIEQLQQEAVACVFRVEAVIPPATS